MLNTDWYINSAVSFSRGKKKHKYGNLFVPWGTCRSLVRQECLLFKDWTPARHYRTLKGDCTTHFFNTYLLIHLFTPSLMRNKQWQKENIKHLKRILLSLKDIVLFCHPAMEKEWDDVCNSKERCVSKCVFVCMCVRGSLEFICEVCSSNGETF